jgi:hypothetical protein
VNITLCMYQYNCRGRGRVVSPITIPYGSAPVAII